MINDRYYIDMLKYEIGEIVLYDGVECEIVYVHESGLMNLKRGCFYIHCLHPMVFFKKNV